jgi:hypothetical protein
MSQSIATDAYRTTAASREIENQVGEALAWLRPRLIELVETMHGGAMTPSVFLAFERALFQLLLGFGRVLLGRVLNGLEGDGSQLPHDVMYLGEGYRRLGGKSRNAHVATLFGTVVLWRFAYRFWEPLVREACVFPLELKLGLIEGATPALADYLGQKLAEAGATQSRVLRNLKREHQVSMGVKRLRKLLAALHENLSEHRQSTQVETLLEALKTANAGRGPRKPVLAVGRDGITIRDYKHRYWEVATVATVTVFDRAGRRLTTVYLAWRPELGQAVMSQMLTDVLQAALRQWEGALPTLAYVADSGYGAHLN